MQPKLNRVASILIKAVIFLLAAGQKSDHIAVYKIDAVTGVLEVLDRYPVGKGPMWITTHVIEK